jgi:thymidine kinase
MSAGASDGKAMVAKKSEGVLKIVKGPMFAGKTTWLSTVVNRAKYSAPVVIAKSAVDVREDKEGFVTHEGDAPSAPPGKKGGHRVRTARVDRLSDVVLADDELTVAVDEGQFHKDLQHALVWLNEGRTVYVAALDADYLKVPFANVVSLEPYANKVTKLVVDACMICGQSPGIHTRLMVASTERILIGSDIYKATCRSCWKPPPLAADGPVAGNDPPASASLASH